MKTHSIGPDLEQAAADANDSRNAGRAVAGILLAAIAYALIYAAAAVATANQCLLLGWPEGRVDLMLTRYCVKFDTVVPAEDIRRARDRQQP